MQSDNIYLFCIALNYNQVVVAIHPIDLNYNQAVVPIHPMDLNIVVVEPNGK
jgi:hypothetical protein